MPRHAISKIVVLIFTLAVLAGCSDKPDEQTTKSSRKSDRKPVVYVSNYPLQYFVKQIAPWVEVRFPANVAGDPAFWKPTPNDVSAMQKADVIVLNGAFYETWFKNVSLPQAKLVNTSAGLTDKFIPLEEHATHSHGLEGEHEHFGTAFTLWLDMTLAKAQVQAVSDAFSARWPDHAAELKQSSAVLTRDLQLLDEQMKAIVSAASSRPVLFSHPVYQYLKKRYGINGKSLHWEPDAMPDERMWQALIHLLNTHPAKWMIWEGTPLPEITERLAEMGITSVVFDPCAGKPEQGDFMSVMKQNVVGLQKVYGSQ